MSSISKLYANDLKKINMLICLMFQMSLAYHSVAEERMVGEFYNLMSVLWTIAPIIRKCKHSLHRPDSLYLDLILCNGNYNLEMLSTILLWYGSKSGIEVSSRLENFHIEPDYFENKTFDPYSIFCPKPFITLFLSFIHPIRYSFIHSIYIPRS